MAEAKNEDVKILDEEDEATLAAIDRGIQSADAGRIVTLEEVRQRMNRAYKIFFTEDALRRLAF